MSEFESTIIPLDMAQHILATFGIDGDSRGYQRWKRDDGFRWVDLEDVLNESPRILGFDWRGVLEIALEEIEEQLAEEDITLEIELDEDGDQGTVSRNGRTRAVKYIPTDDDDFDIVIKSVNELIDDQARYRKFRSCEGSDTWFYAFLSHEDWERLEADAKDTVELLFV